MEYRRTLHLAAEPDQPNTLPQPEPTPTIPPVPAKPAPEPITDPRPVEPGPTPLPEQPILPSPEPDQTPHIEQSPMA